MEKKLLTVLFVVQIISYVLQTVYNNLKNNDLLSNSENSYEKL